MSAALDFSLLGAQPPANDGPVLADLLLDLREVCAGLIECVRLDQVLDGFLFAAGAVQIIEDDLQRDPLSLRRSAQRLGGPFAPPLKATAAAVDAVRGMRPSCTRALEWRAGACEVRDLLADAVVGRPGEWDRERLVVAVAHLRDGLGELAHGLIGEVQRLPSCFRGHDLLPADAVWLAAEYTPVVTDGAVRRDVLVVGVRTSGSYLGPLVAAALRAGGTGAAAASTRPGHPLLPDDVRTLAGVVARGGHVALVDDPPNTGGSLRDSAALLETYGVARDSITVLIPLFGGASPAALRDYRRVELPFDRWAVNELLAPRSIAETLTAMWRETVEHVEIIEEGDGTDGTARSGPGVDRCAGTDSTEAEDRDAGGRRHHVTRVVSARLRSGAERKVVVSGSGVGYLGRHALAVAAAVPQHLPTTHGFRDGLVYRERLPGSSRVLSANVADAAAYGRYVADRAAAMPAVSDRAVMLAGREPAWEQASRLLQRGYGRVGVALRLPLLDRAVRGLFPVAMPSIVDGATGLDNWFRVDGVLRKTRADDLDFGNWDHACYDAIYDLAGVDPGSPDGAFVAALRAAHPTDLERFMLYELVHLQEPTTGWSRDRRASARAVARYLAEIYPAPEPADGPLCALDIDGVLESTAYGFSMITPAALVAARALARHGFRPVPVTGRSLVEVRERCAILGLAGGVAEYGAVVHDHRRDRTEKIVSDADVALLDRLREILRTTPGARVDEDYRYCVRTHRTGEGWRAIRAEVLEGALAVLGDDRHRLRVVPGYYQTDVVAAAVDKGDGLRALARLLGAGPDAPAPVRLAIGDTASDLPMFAVAEHAYAPVNASREIRESGVQVLRQGYAAGVVAAVTRVLGHRPGSCPACRPAPPVGNTRVLLSILDAPHAGRAGLPLAVARLAAGVALRRRRDVRRHRRS